VAVDTYDYIVVGAGSAGCVLANRLSADPANRVCLVEAGPSDRSGMAKFKTRIPTGNVMTLPSTRYNWGYNFTGAAGLRNREIPSHRGRVFGGSSSVNGMVYTRGFAKDYDEWVEQGNPGWGWSDVLPMFKAQEHHEGGADAFHGTGGELNVAKLRYVNPVSKAFVKAAGETQYPTEVDFNGAEPVGFAPYEVTQKGGQRWNSSRAFLQPIVSRPNLTVMHEAMTLRIRFDGKRAAGLTVRHEGREIELNARREIILSGGAYNSPQLLMLSGIGDADELKKQGIAVVHHLPGVGKNLQDHATGWIEMEDRSKKSAAFNLGTIPRYTLAVLNYMFAGGGPLTSNNVEAGGFVNTKPGLEKRPDLQYVFMPAYRAPGEYIPRNHGFTLMSILLRPKSRGYMELVSARPEDRPILHPNFVDHAEDMDTLVYAHHLGRQILSAPAMNAMRGEEIRPGKHVQSRAEIEEFIRNSVTTSYHPVGTCKMAPANDPGAVVDHRLRVRGIEGLRVVDASIMPTIISGNTNSPSMMIGGMGASFILEDAKAAKAA
jgi:choline dehydrogenase-like flavoprotein